MHVLVAEQPRRAEHRLDDELRRDLAREAEQDAGLDHRLRQEREVGGARARDGGDRVHVRLGHAHDGAEVAERGLREREMLLVRVRARAEPCHALVDGGRPVRHRPHDRDTFREPPLDRCGRDRGGNRQYRGLRAEQAADLSQQLVEVLRLHGDHYQGGAAHGFGVRRRGLDAIPLRQLGGSLLAADGDHDL